MLCVRVTAWVNHSRSCGMSFHGADQGAVCWAWHPWVRAGCWSAGSSWGQEFDAPVRHSGARLQRVMWKENGG